MGNETAELVESGEKRDGRGRKIVPLERQRELIAAYENAIRPSAIGKKNWLFIGHPDAGDRTAIIYSLVVSCQRRGIDPFAYLKDVLARLHAMTNRDDLSLLTPANWKPA